MGLVAGLWLLAGHRMRAYGPLLAATALGVLFASTLLAIVPIYANAMADLGLRYRLDRGIADPADRMLSMEIDGSQLGARPDTRRREAMDVVTQQRIGWLGSPTLVEERSQRVQATSSRTPATPWPAFIEAVSGLETNVEVVAGRLPAPRDRAEVVLPAGYERHVSLGDTVTLVLPVVDDCPRVPSSEDPAVAAAEIRCQPSMVAIPSGVVTVVGFVTRRAPGDLRWRFFDSDWSVPAAPDARATEPGVGAMLLLTSTEQFEGPIAERFPELRARHRVGLLPDLQALRVQDVPAAIDDIDAWQRDVRTTLGLRAGGRLDLAKHLGNYRDAQTFSRVPLFLILLQVVGVVVFYLVLAASLLLERQAAEIGVYRSRGASAGQLAMLAALEAACIAIPAALLSPWLAALVVALLGRLPVFAQSVGSGALPVVVTPESYGYAALGGVVSIVAVTVPAWWTARGSVMDVRRERARPQGRGFVQRYFLDIGIVVLAGVQSWQLAQRGSVFDPKSVGGWSSDPLLLLFPFVFTLAAAAVVLRLYSPLLRFALRAIAPLRSTAAAVGLLQTARAPSTYARVLILLMMAMSVATFAASYGPTVSRSHRDRAQYEAGVDLRAQLAVQPAGSNVDEQLLEVRKLAGVHDATLAYRGSVRAPSGPDIAVLGIEDPSRASPMLWSRPDFAVEPLPALLGAVQSQPGEHFGLPLPADATVLQVYLYPDTQGELIGLAARLRDGAGAYQELPVLELQAKTWRLASFALPKDLPRPLYLAGFRLRDESFIRRDGSAFFDDLATLDAGGKRTVLDDFEAPSGWRVYTQAGTNEGFDVSAAQVRAGVRAGRWTWETSFSQRETVLAAPDPDGALPVLLSRGALTLLGAHAGGETQVALENTVRVPLQVAGVVDLFPTLDPATPFMVVDRVRFRALSLTGGARVLPFATELWVDVDEGRSLSDQRALLSRLVDGKNSPMPLDATTASIRDVSLDAARADPTLVASGAGVLLVAAIAVVTIAAVGSIVTALLVISGRVTEFAVLRAMGVSRVQLLRSLLLEWSVLAVCGATLGVMLGRRLATVMLSALDVTATGSRVVPPFTLEGDWVVIGSGLAVIGACALLAVVLAWSGAVSRANAAALRQTQ